MTRVGVMSDSHGAENQVINAACEMQNCQYIVHLGDYIRDAEFISSHNPANLIALRGNCDWFSTGEESGDFEIEGVKVYACHGHREGVKGGLLMLALRAEERGARLVLYGHTHVANITEEDGRVFLNPGALRDGRYAIVEIDGNRIRAELKRL